MFEQSAECAMDISTALAERSGHTPNPLWGRSNTYHGNGYEATEGQDQNREEMDEDIEDFLDPPE